MNQEVSDIIVRRKRANFVFAGTRRGKFER